MGVMSIRSIEDEIDSKSPVESPEMLVAGGLNGNYTKYYLKKIYDIL